MGIPTLEEAVNINQEKFEKLLLVSKLPNGNILGRTVMIAHDHGIISTKIESFEFTIPAHKDPAIYLYLPTAPLSILGKIRSLIFFKNKEDTTPRWYIMLDNNTLIPAIVTLGK